MDLEAVTQQLYGLTPSEFTAARDAMAAETRRSGDRLRAAAIKQLKRPSAAAWLANAVVRERPDRIEDLLALGDHLRDAQRRLAGEELKDLARAGHRVVAELVADAERLASVAGHRPSASALRQLQETLDAAMADPEAARALRSGRLTAALSYAGLGGFVDETAAAVTGDQRKAAAVERAMADLDAAQRHAAELSAELQSAHRRRDRLQEQLDDMQRQLQQVRAQETEVDELIERLETAVVAANSEIEAARSRLSPRD